ncbi:Modulator of FtsH protease HflK [Botrimarina colliarenosi]|uniref:Modulator of FtsH protease HflK n=1 Tax=Botrimarina colliarenosi TaxID=2528001 RepID=A0A5C6ABJ8_9BACT|nr:prohibitin family protein [Botrimarina colliarenosi]TWT96816.1 Modulator of FtsH protease HflK [Botrimarina colliarenosi]
MQNNSYAVGALAVLVIVAALAFQSFVTVESGNVGVVTRFGAVQEGVLEPGLHAKIPFVTQVIPLETRIKKVEADATASSKDLQIVTSKIVLNYRIDRDAGDKLYEQLGLEYDTRIVEPALQESIKATTARYTAEELITLRATVAKVMEDDLVERLQTKHIIPTDLSIIDFQFSSVFNDAIEQKQVAQQAVLRASNELERVRIEADQAQAEAKGKADAELERARAESEAQKLLRDTISPELLQLRAIEKWDGKLPIYSGGELPMPIMPVPTAN